MSRNNRIILSILGVTSAIGIATVLVYIFSCQRNTNDGLFDRLDVTLPEPNDRYQNVYKIDELIGVGSFSFVNKGINIETKEDVAIKQVLMDSSFCDSELKIMLMLKHPNIVELKDYYYSEDKSNGNNLKFINYVMEYVPSTLYQSMKTYRLNNEIMPMKIITIYMFQICRAIGYMHLSGLIHRDLKLENLLLDFNTNTLKLCDFGTSEPVVNGRIFNDYVGSRRYKAPETLIGPNERTTGIDVWSIGCIMYELLTGCILFDGDNNIDQFIKIIRIMGTPNQDIMKILGRNNIKLQFPIIKPVNFHGLFPNDTPKSAIDLILKFLEYDPKKRLHPIDALRHEFFNDLIDDGNKYTEHMPKSLFKLTKLELDYIPADFKMRLQKNTD